MMRNIIMKISSVLLLYISGITCLQAQDAVPAAGGNGSGSGGSMSYTFGQINYTTNLGSNGSVAQGVQQPYEISIISGIEEAKSITLEFMVYPNPVKDLLWLKAEHYSLSNLTYSLYDMNGKLLESKKLEGGETNITMAGFAAAAYFLRITDNYQIIKTFKIIKN